MFVHVHVFECLCLRMVTYWCLSMFRYLSACVLGWCHTGVCPCSCILVLVFKDGAILVVVHVHVFECLCLRMVPYWCLSIFMYLNACV